MPLGEGHVRKREYERSGRRWTRWVATLELEPDAAGERRRRSRSFERRDDARAWLAEERERLGVWGQRVPPTVGVLLDAWLRHGSGIKGWSPSHARRSRQLVASDLAPLRAVRADRLSLDAVQRLLAARTASGLAPDSLRLIRAALSGAYRLAERRGWIPEGTNPARHALIARSAPRPPRFLTPEQVSAFQRATADHPYGLLWLTALTLALRPSEALGLYWSDLVLDPLSEARVTIRRGLQHEDGRDQLLPLKTPEARRTLPLPRTLAAALTAERKRLGTPVHTLTGSETLVFRTPDGAPLNESRVNRALGAALREAGLPHVTFYELRHTGATLRLHMGVPLEQVRDLLGHRGLEMTLRYARVTEPLRRDAASKVDAFLRAGPAAGPTAPAPRTSRHPRRLRGAQIRKPAPFSPRPRSSVERATDF